MPSVSSGGSEFSQLVADHVLRHVDVGEGLAGVHQEGVAHEIGRDHRATAPCLDGLFVARLGRRVDLGEELLIHERAFFQ